MGIRVLPQAAQRPVAVRRRLALGLGVGVLALGPLGCGAALAQAAAAKAPLRLGRVGVFSMLGDAMQLTAPGAPSVTAVGATAASAAGRSVPRNNSEPLVLKDIGLDPVALRTAREALATLQPAAVPRLFRATGPLTVNDQRSIADGAHRSELPGWIVELIGSHKLEQVLLLTLDRGDAAFATPAGETLGQGLVDGAGFYLDNRLEPGQSPADAAPDRAYIAPYLQMRLTLMDVHTGAVLGSIGVSDGTVHFARTREQAAQPWNILDGAQKVQALRGLVQVNVARALPLLLER